MQGNQMGFVQTEKFLNKMSVWAGKCMCRPLTPISCWEQTQVLAPYPILSFFCWHQKKRNFLVLFRKLM